MSALQILDLSRILNGGALLAKCKIRLPNRLEISDVAIFVKDGKRWAALPSEVQRDYTTGQPVKDENGRAKYRSSLRWSTRELQNSFSEAVIAAVEAAHGPLDAAVAAPQPASAEPHRRAPYRRQQPSEAAPPADPLNDEIPF